MAHQAPPPPPGPSASELAATFDATSPLTVGLEEEVILRVPGTRDVAPVATEIVAEVGHPSVKTEMPACQVELVTRPHPDVAGAVAELAEARIRLLAATSGSCAPVAAAVHPWVSVCELGSSPHHRRVEDDFGAIARRQLVGSVQVHVAVGSATATLAVYNALRGHLPELAALAASAPFHDGHDTGLASVRPLIAGLLPRQGVPPALGSWQQLADDLRWGRASGAVPDPGRWWWELRPHIGHGTLEVRVPDAQATIEGVEALTRTVHTLVAWLLHRHLDGEDLGAPETWRIAENRWRALRGGVQGELLDLVTGIPCSTGTFLERLLDRIEPHAGGGDLDGARRLARRNGADQLRGVGLERSLDWQTEAFRPAPTGGRTRVR